MTAQISDIYKFQNQEFTLVALSSVMPFDPESFGLEPHSSLTACWRGYWCEYTIATDALLLENLYLFNSNNNYPPLNGIKVSPPEFVERVCYSSSENRYVTVTELAHFGHRVYKDINMPIPYTGKILLGGGFLHEYYIHMGHQKSWAYQKLIELVFENGLLLKHNDLSHISKAQRETIKNKGFNPWYPSFRNASLFSDESFPPDYANKAWWL